MQRRRRCDRALRSIAGRASLIASSAPARRLSTMFLLVSSGLGPRRFRTFRGSVAGDCSRPWYARVYGTVARIRQRCTSAAIALTHAGCEVECRSHLANLALPEWYGSRGNGLVEESGTCCGRIRGASPFDIVCPHSHVVTIQPYYSSQVGQSGELHLIFVLRRAHASFSSHLHWTTRNRKFVDPLSRASADWGNHIGDSHIVNMLWHCRSYKGCCFRVSFCNCIFRARF